MLIINIIIIAIIIIVSSNFLYSVNSSDEGGYGVTYDSEVRLIDGTWSSSGVLEVYIQDEGKWGTICSTDFNQEAADSACRQVGYTNAIGYNGVDNP